MPWIDDVLKAVDAVETPRSYLRWACLVAISSVVRDNVYLKKQGVYQLYPNIYVLLVGASGLKKSFATNLAKNLVKRVDCTRLIAGRSSIQGIVQDLSLAVTKPGRPPLVKAHGAVINDEFSASLVEDPKTFDILTALYDRHYNDEWKNMLKQGTETLKDVYVTFFSATTPDKFNEMVGIADIRGGFIARTVIVKEMKRAKKNALVDDGGEEVDYAKLAEHLVSISKLSGPFTWVEEARTAFKKWYYELDPESDETGVLNRIHDTVLKVTMLLSLSRGTDMLLTLEDLEGSMSLLANYMHDVKEVTGGVGKSEFAPKIAQFLKVLTESPEKSVTKATMQRKCWKDFNVYEMDVVVETLITAKAITKEQNGSNIVFKATKQLLNDYQYILKKQEK